MRVRRASELDSEAFRSGEPLASDGGGRVMKALQVRYRASKQVRGAR